MKPEFFINGAGQPNEYTLKFDVMSLVGRKFFPKQAPLKNGYLNLGCGSRYFDDYCNADIYSFNWLRKILGKPQIKIDWGIDLRQRFACPNDFYDGVFTEHVMEHLTVFHVQNVFSEVHRILKPGGTFRVSVPDMAKYVAYYNGETPHDKFKMWDENRGEALWSMAYNWGHHSLYDLSLMTKLLQEAGFKDIKESSFNKSRDDKLLLDDKGRLWESLYVEATK